MKGREGKGGAPPADLLVCFPSRAHLSLMPKPICSPARPSEPNKRHHNRHHNHHHHLKKLTAGGGGGGQASPLLWTKSKPMGPEMGSEPTSPKVTCAGQIKVRTKAAAACKNWQSVMEEIERIHNSRSRKKKKRPSWIETLGLKKEILQFVACLRSIRFDFRCFGSQLPESDLNSDEEEEEEEDFLGNQTGEEASSSRTIFSKWFMVLQENQSGGGSGRRSDLAKRDWEEGKSGSEAEESAVVAPPPPPPPPPNALLLMRCRSAPANSWLEERQEDEENRKEREREMERERERKEDEEKKKRRDNLVVMRYDANFYKLSSEIAKETWVVGGIGDPLSRSRSWKR